MKEYNFIKKINNEFHVTEEEIAIVEKEYGIKFPQVLREYYAKYNGDYIKLCTFFVEGYEYGVAKVVQLKYGTATFEKIVKNDREDGFIDSNMFPLARNEGGDYFYWDIVSEAVFMCYCDDIENPIYISNNIEDFFAMMELGCEA